MRRWFLVVTVFVLLALPSLLGSAHAQQPDIQLASAPGITSASSFPGYAPDRVLVKLRVDTAPAHQADGRWQTGEVTLDRLLTGIQARSAHRLFPSDGSRSTSETAGLERIYVLHLAPGSDAGQAVNVLAADPGVEWAEFDYLAYPAATPDDPLLSQQWGLTRIGAPAAWDVATGSAAVPIAIVDSGIDLTHPDLESKLWVNPGEVAGNGLDDDNNGYVDDVTGWDLVNGDNDPSDDHGHGTQVAGVAAAATDNGLGVAGVCWRCRLMAVKVMQASGVANYSDVAAGVLYAAQKGARVINLSLGGYSDSSALRAAVQAATESYGAVVVAGAGNDNVSTPFYPAAYDQVLAVAGTDQADVKAPLSNVGPWVDVSAPALSITTSFMGGDYGVVDGTSYAASFAAGLAGLLRSQNPGWSAGTVWAHIVHTADDVDSVNPGYEGKLGQGRINAGTAVTTPALPLLTTVGFAVDGTVNGRPEPGSTVDLAVTLYNDWADAWDVQGTLSSSDPLVTIVNGTAFFEDIRAYTQGASVTPFRFSVSPAAPFGHDINLNLQVTAAGGYVANLSLAIQTTSPVVDLPPNLSSQTWTPDRIYLINEDTDLPAGNTLVIEPGVQVRFEGSASLRVSGTLLADGTQAEPILLTSNMATRALGDWGRIDFLDSSTDATFDPEGHYTGGSILRHTIMEYGQGIYLQSAAPFISNNLFRHLAGVGPGYEGLLSEPNAGPTILDNTFEGKGMVLFDGGGVIAGNFVSGAPMGGIVAYGAPILTGNRVTACDQGIAVSGSGGVVSGNLLAGNGDGLVVNGVATVISNTIVLNEGAAVRIIAGAPVLHHNNLVARQGQQALHNDSGNDVDATGNWWGTSDDVAIQQAIYDAKDDPARGTVDYGGYLVSPESSAPAFLAEVRVLPDTTIGIQTATFDLVFSRPMDQSTGPAVSFQSVRHRTWTVYNTSNSGLPWNEVQAVAVAPDGSHWFGTLGGGVAHLDGNEWTVYKTSNSGLPENNVHAILIDPDGAAWFGTFDRGVATFDGTGWTTIDGSNSILPRPEVPAIARDADGSHWFATDWGGVAHLTGTHMEVFDTINSGLPNDRVWAVVTDPDGTHWFGTWGGGVARFDGASWTVYSIYDSGLPSSDVIAMAADPDGSHWFGMYGGGVAHLSGTNWTVYNTLNSELPAYDVLAVATAPDGSHWFGTRGGGAAHLDRTTWTIYDTSNSPLPDNDVRAIALDPDGSCWYGTDAGAAVFWNKPVYSIWDSAQWLDDRTYRLTLDVSTLIPRDDYLMRVAAAASVDGMETVPAEGYTFTIDYAGAIGDTTPPPLPMVQACAPEEAGSLSASWSAYDPDSSITLCRYAVGTTPGGTDVINWTNTSELAFTRTGLGLIAGPTYFVVVQVRNEGGLWSEAGIPDGLAAGSGICTTNKHSIYLPLLVRR